MAIIGGGGSRFRGCKTERPEKGRELEMRKSTRVQHREKMRKKDLNV